MAAQKYRAVLQRSSRQNLKRGHESAAVFCCGSVLHLQVAPFTVPHRPRRSPGLGEHPWPLGRWRKARPTSASPSSCLYDGLTIVFTAARRVQHSQHGERPRGRDCGRRCAAGLGLIEPRQQSGLGLRHPWRQSGLGLSKPRHQPRHQPRRQQQSGVGLSKPRHPSGLGLSKPRRQCGLWLNKSRHKLGTSLGTNLGAKLSTLGENLGDTLGKNLVMAAQNAKVRILFSRKRKTREKLPTKDATACHLSSTAMRAAANTR